MCVACVRVCVSEQAAVALDMEPNLGAALDAAKENSFLARLSLLDPRTLDPVQAEKIGDLLDAGAGEGGNEGERGEKKKRECTFFKERERRIVVRITNKAPTTCAVEVLPPIGSFWFFHGEPRLELSSSFCIRVR